MNEIALVADEIPHDRSSDSQAGCVDLQVNGYAGLDFNGQPITVDQLTALCQRLDQDGVGAILATVITAPLEQMVARISALAMAIENHPHIAKKIIGLHIEGPFINPETGYVGAHPATDVRRANWDDCERILDAGRGAIRLWTLAPEMDAGADVTRRLANRGVKVAAGHSNASLNQLREAIDQGLTLYTHLGNGCPATLPRHDNIIQRVLSLSDRLHISFIADGHHVPLFALQNYLHCIPMERVIIVSDCMSAAGLGPGTYPLGDQTVYVDDDLAAWSADRTHFAGSATTLPQMQAILCQKMGFSKEQTDLLTRLNPSAYLRQ
jgi:N-acetylglucosamine-6-phosphate deacetylase